MLEIKDQIKQQIADLEFDIQNDKELKQGVKKDLNKLYRMAKQFKEMSYYDEEFLENKTNQNDNPLPQLNELIVNAESLLQYYDDRITTNKEELKKLDKAYKAL